MDQLNWLVNHRFQEALRYEFSWAFVFDEGASATVECLWRLVENGRIRVTSQDDGHQFGLPAAIDGVLEVNQRLTGAMVDSVALSEGSLDLEIRFDTGHALQFIAVSSGYEAWSMNDRSRQFIAVGGGELAVVGKNSSEA
ncbi:MAG: DUF6188 family protein [Pirellulales bacterium]